MLRLLICSALSAAAALAQTASITGRITDPGGAVVPDASIAAKSTESGVTTQTRSNSDGYYSLATLPPGHYDLTVNKPGFAPIAQTGLVLEVQQVARLDFTLQLGAVSSHVEVNEAALLLDSQTATHRAGGSIQADHRTSTARP